MQFTSTNELFFSILTNQNIKSLSISSGISYTYIIIIINGTTRRNVVAPERYMHENSFMLIHQLASASWGKYEDLKDSMTNNDLLMETIKSLYIKYTKIPKEKLEDILKHDLWWGAKTCLEYGLIDDII